MDGSVAAAKMPQTAKQRGKIAPAKLGHVVLKTPPERVKLMLEWYKTVLGFPGTKDRVDGLAGMHHMAFTYASLSDLAHTYNRL